jgi:adenylate cyclase
VVFGRSKVERLIDGIEELPPAERSKRVNEIRAEIDAEEDPSKKEFYGGVLDEALGSPSRAAGGYASAAKAGHGGAERRLTALLRHSECRVRVSAAKAIERESIVSAKGELQDLAENGGPGEEPHLPLVGCDSKQAAKEALRRLE